MDETTAAAGESENKDILTEDETEITTVDIGKSDSGRAALIYGISDQPPWIMSFALALQHFSSNFTGCIVLPILLSKSLCFDKQDELLTKLIATSFFTTGIGTMLQVFLGCRLPILQGPAAAYLIPLIAMLQVRGDCPVISTANTTAVENNLLREEAFIRIREVQGVMMLAALVQCIIGFTGLIGTLLRFIGPITIGVTIFMIGVGIIPVAMNLVEDHWCISIPTIFLVICFSMFLSNVSVPFPEAMEFVYLPFSQSMGNAYFQRCRICWRSHSLVASMLDSLGDYHACSQVSLVPPPPLHAVNRGIGLEGIGCMIGALWGAGVGVTSRSSDIAVLNLTKVASRTVLILSGLIFAVVAFLVKFSALMNAIPTPVLGASAVVIGTYEDRGMDWRTKTSQDNTAVTMSTELSVYQLPFGMRWIQKKNWMRYVPFSPTFAGFRQPYNTAVPDDSSV
ncbi:Solute carrier family 23 member 2 [Apostichopus japonicus]|uniref:Solute carrier family 23 member 2 n=1 Tax=Stichopus japonicus TaxID=307972 RepID=A0A2G8JTZ3_STIJA|nr:Solute carrier family 23 member 2 [Apostichopus japonicus]